MHGSMAHRSNLSFKPQTENEAHIHNNSTTNAHHVERLVIQNRQLWDNH